MSSQKQQEISPQYSEVSKFYEGKSLFITGAAGYLGVIFLEIVLRCLPGIHHVYILLRPKKGILPEDRKEAIFKKEIYYKIKEKDPDVLKKVVVVSGDVSEEDLGINSDDLQRICQEVTIVFHCAAAISFLKPLSFMIQQNVIGTNNVIELCRKLKKLDAFVYTSTAFSNCNLECTLEEKIYKLPFTVEEAIRTFKNGNEEELMSLFSKCNPKFPNFYTFTKSLSETLIVEKAADLPVSIIRPSIIVSCFKGILPGYVEDGTGMVTLGLGVGKGFIRVMRCDPTKKPNLIPVNLVANTHILAAYLQVVESLPTPFIYNCVSTHSWTWEQFSTKLMAMVLKHPLPKSYQKPSLTICKSPVKYWIISIFDHYLPAVVIDFLLWLSGRKPRLLKLYRFYDRCINAIMHFMMREWEFNTDNFKSLDHKLNTVDKNLFSTDLSDYTIEEISESLITGSPLFRTNNSNKNSEKRAKSTYMHYYLTPFIKWSVVGCIASVFYMVVF